MKMRAVKSAFPAGIGTRRLNTGQYGSAGKRRAAFPVSRKVRDIAAGKPALRLAPDAPASLFAGGETGAELTPCASGMPWRTQTSNLALSMEASTKTLQNMRSVNTAAVVSQLF
jgi:hypothetical protein